MTLTSAQTNDAVTVIAGNSMTRQEARGLLQTSLEAFRSGARLTREQMQAVNAAAWALQF